MHTKELVASQLGRVAHERLRLPVVLSSSAEGEITEQTGGAADGGERFPAG